MSEAEKWKRRYFQMRKFNGRCADSAERTLHLIAKGGEQ